MDRSLTLLGKKQYVFGQLTNLCLYDLKAQKKTMSMKKFHNIPLNRQQVMQLKFNRHVQDDLNRQEQFYQTQFRIRIGKRRKEKLLQRLAIPKHGSAIISSLIGEEQQKTIQSTEKIIKKCSKLKDKVLTENRIQKVQKNTQKQYMTLLQQSKWCLAVHCSKRS